MKDWKQEIAELIRARCDHGPGSMLIGAGCPDCQGLYLDIMWTVDQALDGLADEIGHYASNSTPDVVRRFKRSLPDG